jgi:hypothetical protein
MDYSLLLIRLKKPGPDYETQNDAEAPESRGISIEDEDAQRLMETRQTERVYSINTNQELSPSSKFRF